MSTNLNAGRSKRVELLDELRGFAIILMVLYHAAYDLVAIFGLDFPVFYSRPVQFIQTFIASLFILISGVACHYSRNNLKRGLIAFGFGMVLSVVTLLVLPSQRVMFGILHFLGIAMILFALLRKPLARIPAAAGVPIFVALFILTLYVPYGTLGFPPFAVELPAALYNVGFLFPLGFPAPTFFSSDYFAIIPWFFLFLAGSFLGIYIKEGKMPAFAYRSHAPLFAKAGRYSMWIYLLHQPVIYGIFWVVFSFII